MIKEILHNKNGVVMFVGTDVDSGSVPIEYTAGKSSVNYGDDSLMKLKFQTTSLSSGRDGVTNEEVIEVLIHRLSSLQQGTMKHLENDLALNHLRLALTHLQMREQKLAEQHVCKCASKL